MNPRIPSSAPDNSRNHGVSYHQRRHRPAVVLRLLGHGLLPHQFAGRAVERQQVRVVRHEEDFVIADRHAAIRAERRIAVQSSSLRPRVLPDLVARSEHRCAYTWFGPVTYITPPASSGVTSSP